MTCTIVESYHDATDYRLQPPLKSAVKQPSDTRRKIERALADFGVVSRTDVEAIVENRLTKWTNGLQLQVVKSIEPTLADALKAICFNSYSGLEFALFNVFEQALDKEVRYRCAPTVSTAEIGRLVQTKAVADMIVKLVMSNMGLIVPIAKTVPKIIGRAVDEYHLRDKEEASATVADDEPSKDHLPPRATRPS